MSKYGSNPVINPRLHYLSGISIAGTDVSQVVVLPSEVEIVKIMAESGNVYYAINGTFAQANSPGFCSEDNVRLEGPLGNFSSLHILAGQGVTAHLQFYRRG